MSKQVRWLSKDEAKKLNLKVKENEKNRSQARYRITFEQWRNILKDRDTLNVISENKTESNEYNKPKFVLSAWNVDNGQMMDIDCYCKHYSLPREDISSYKLVSHTGTPYYNIVFKENVSEQVKTIDFDSIIKKHIKKVNIPFVNIIEDGNDFDSLTYTDVHVGMETDPDNNSMYAVKWNRETILEYANKLVETTILEQESNMLVVDELGDFLDGLNAQTTRGGHPLPQNMTNEEAFDCALEFKMILIDGLVNYYDNIIFNNICNDNHAGSFGYFVNKAFKDICNIKYPKVKIVNHRQFINHYFVKDICFLITHGKDDKALKFGFKPQLDSKGLEKIDQYCKQNGIYKKAELIIFKKGDSHQALFDMCTSDDFYYFNYPALSPSSQWVQTNFKKGRRGFVNESFKDLKHYIKTNFITE